MNRHIAQWIVATPSIWHDAILDRSSRQNRVLVHPRSGLSAKRKLTQRTAPVENPRLAA